MVIAPADMIAMDESRSSTYYFQASYSQTAKGALSSATDSLVCVVNVPGWDYPLQHGRNCNLVFCDAHVEAMPSLKLFNPTNSAIRWNNDHQPHPETW